MVDLQNIKNGALMSRVNRNIDEIINNIMDPNTDPTKARTVTITLKFKSNMDRDEINCEMQSKATLQALNSVKTIFAPVESAEGIRLQELRSGAMPGQRIIDAATGEILDTPNAIRAIK